MLYRANANKDTHRLELATFTSQDHVNRPRVESVDTYWRGSGQKLLLFYILNNNEAVVNTKIHTYIHTYMRS